MSDKNIPFVFINGYYPAFESSYVIEDDEFGGYIAAEHLFGHGHNRIGGIFKIDDIQGHNRYKGVVKAHRERGVSVAEESVIWYTTEDMENLFDMSNSKALVKRFANCSGIICYNDQIALKLLELFKKENLTIPEDVSIVSFDDSELATASEVKLTTVAHPVGKLGEKAAYGLLSILGHGTDKIREIMKPELIVRNSTKK
jgi:Transcriptional regulators